MKAALYDIKGEKKSEVTLPSVFKSKVREDIAQKYFEANKFYLMQAYSPYEEAGRRHSASGIVSHRRHKWKGHYGKGISRVPRKIMSRRGTQFFWIGAEVSGTRGGRKVHSPTGLRRPRKINKKEVQIALNSAIASTANKNYILKRYSSLNNIPLSLPLIIDKIDNTKTKEFINFIKNMFGEMFNKAIKNKSERSGKGRRRGRRYKSNAGLILIKSKDENFKMTGIDVKNVNEVGIQDLYPLGRIAVYTEKALKELENKK